jgi:hypothetical protein
VGVRQVGLDVRRDFCEVAIVEAGAVVASGRVQTTREALELFGRSLVSDDQVALEVTGNAWEIARILGRHVGGVVVVNPSVTGIAQARAKTDRLDARAVAGGGRAGCPDQRTARCGGDYRDAGRWCRTAPRPEVFLDQHLPQKGSTR